MWSNSIDMFDIQIFIIFVVFKEIRIQEGKGDFFLKTKLDTIVLPRLWDTFNLIIVTDFPLIFASNQDFHNIKNMCFMLEYFLVKMIPYRAIDSDLSSGSMGCTKDWPIKKMTNFELGHFTTIFGHFFANYIYIFHKTEVLMVILRG